MKLLICTGIFPPEPGGPATYSMMLARALQGRGHQVKVITYSSSSVIASEAKQSRGIASSPPAADSRNDNYLVIPIARSWFKPWHYFKYYRAVLKYGRETDVLYAQDPVSAGYPTYLAARTLKKPFVVKITGDHSWEQAMNRKLTDKLIDEFQGLPSYPWPINKIRDIQIRVCKVAEAVITPSEYLKRLVIGWGVKENRVQVIYNSVEPVPGISKDQARHDLGLAQGEFLILSVGRDVPWKGFDMLKEVVEELFQSVIPAKPALDSDRGAGIHSQIKLVILNDADRATINKYFRSADIFVLNTGYEGFSHTILEAMSAGLPVVTTNVGGNAEVVRSGENGILVEYNNREQLKAAILKLYNDPSLRKRLAQNAEATIVTFSFENMISKTEELLKICVS